MKVLRVITRVWKRFAHALGRIQTAVVLSLVYFLVVPPFALIRLKDPLRRRRLAGPTFWEPMEGVDTTPEEAERRY